jgi:hypothetical protein
MVPARLSSGLERTTLCGHQGGMPSWPLAAGSGRGDQIAAGEPYRNRG